MMLMIINTIKVFLLYMFLETLVIGCGASTGRQIFDFMLGQEARDNTCKIEMIPYCEDGEWTKNVSYSLLNM